MEIIKFKNNKNGVEEAFELNSGGSLKNSLGDIYVRLASAIYNGAIKVKRNSSTGNFKCRYCNETHKDIDGMYISGYGLICDKKYEQEVTIKECPVCGKNKTYIGSTVYNKECICSDLSKSTSKCAICGDAISSHEHITLMHGNPTCTKCATQSILDYSTNKIYRVPKDGQRRYGVELEISEGGKDSNKARDLAKFVPCMVVGDGSLNAGFEVVVDPFTIDEHISLKYKEFFARAKVLGYKKHSSCGMHIHTGIDSFESMDHLSTTLFVVNKLLESLEVITKRKPSKYCQERLRESTSQYSYELALRTGSGDIYEKYSAINVRNVRTIELRVPAGAVSYEHVIKNIVLYDAIIEASKGYSMSSQINLEDVADKINTLLQERCKDIDFSPINPFKDKKIILKKDGEIVYGVDNLDELESIDRFKEYSKAPIQTAINAFEKNKDFLNDEIRLTISKIIEEGKVSGYVYVSNRDMYATMKEVAIAFGFEIIEVV